MVYVIDTSVLLSDHRVLDALQDKDLVIPLVVLTELESKKSHPVLGFAAREALRRLESLRVASETSLVEAVPLKQGGTLRIELNNISTSGLPHAFQTEESDNRILAVAHNLSASERVTLLSKDIALKLKASTVGIEAVDPVGATLEDPLPITRVDVTQDDIDDLYTNKIIQLDEWLRPGIPNGYGKNTKFLKAPVNTNLILCSPQGSALARLKSDLKIHLVSNQSVFDVKGRSAEQRFALDLLKDEDVDIVSLAGKAGTGKSMLALAAGLEQTLESNQYNKVIVFRPLYAVGGQDLGFLPGDADEKMNPWTAAVYDALEAFCNDNVIEEIIARELLEVLPLTHIRGRTLTNSFIIFDEVQNYDTPVILTALSRLGQNSKAVLTYDVAQRDNLRVGKLDGIASVAMKLAGHPIFGHVTLQKSERSRVAELVSSLLE